MPDYYLAPSLARLRDEVNERWPRRDRASDGWIGDPAHSARESDHNPDWDAGGVVRALDVDVDDLDPATDLRRELLNVTIGDPRVWYVISNGRIYSVTYGWAAHTYYGENPHFMHVHISLRHENEAETDISPWWAPERRRRIRPIVDLSELRKAWKTGERNPHVRRLQRALNLKLDAALTVDGVAGEATERVWLTWERSLNITNPNRTPHLHSVHRLGRGRFAVRR